MQPLSVDDIPCFARSVPEPLTLKQVNFIFGPNGSGKSSLARKFATESTSSNSDVKILLYNREYKDRIIKGSNSLRGLLTVGSGAVEAKKRLDAAKEQLKLKEEARDRNQARITSPDPEVEGEQQKRARLEITIRELLWKRRGKVVPQDILKGLYPGTIGSKESFQEAIIPAALALYHSNRPNDEETSLEHIVKRFSQLQTTKGTHLLSVEPTFTALSIDENALNGLLTSPILNESDSEYAKSISLLQAGSWFERGLALLNQSEPKCPFCQCTLGEDLIRQIRQAFSDDYTEKNESLESQSEMIRNDIESLGRILNGLSDIDVLDTSPLETAVLTLREHLREILNQVDIKKDAPAAALDPISVGPLSETVFSELYKLNQSIVSLNNDAANHEKLEKQLVRAAIPALLSETWSEIEPHLKEYENSQKAEQGVQNQLSAIEADIQALKATIDEEGRKVRDSKVHLTNINSLINYMVGDAFRLEETDEGDEPSNYRVVRHDGSPVGKYLSEGEEQLLAFLYFISEVWNVGEDGTDVEESRAVVIIDDPMSSLDSDLLFGVSSLIVDLIDGMEIGRYQIEQLTCLSHNAAFYNNLTYRFKQSDNRFQHFMIRKKDFGYNEVVAAPSSPVTSVYANLWKSVKRAESAHEPDNVALANTMRRILENYFSAGNSLSRLRDIEGFKRTDQVAINSLVSWANAGSHNLMDSVEVGLSDIGVQTYLRVFRAIFTETGHGAHYDMMMA